MAKNKPIIVISYIPETGAIVQIDIEAIPTPFHEGDSYQSDIYISLDKDPARYKLFFEFKKESISPTGISTPAFALGLIRGMLAGPPIINEYSIHNVSKKFLELKL